MAAGYVDIKIVEADDLVAKDLTGSSDPYVLMSMEGVDPIKSTIKKETLSPHWDEDFQIQFPDDRHPLVFSVWDYNRVTKDEIIGSIEIGMHDMPEEDGPAQWYQLRTKKKEKVGRLKMQLKVTFDDTFLSNFKAVEEEVVDAFQEEDFSLNGLVKNTMDVINQLYFLIEFYLYIYSLVTWEVPLSSAASWIMVIFICMRPQFISPLLPVPILVYIIKEYVATSGLGPDFRTEDPAQQPTQSSGFFTAIKETTAWCKWFQNLMKWLAEQIIWVKELFQWRDYYTTLYIAYGCFGFMILNILIPIRFTILVLVSYVYFSNTIVYRGLYFLYCGFYSFAYNKIRIMMHRAKTAPRTIAIPSTPTSASISEDIDSDEDEKDL